MSTSAPNARPPTATAAAPSPFPDQHVLQTAAKLAIEQDKPIMFDYYNETRNGTAFLGEDTDTKEKMLVKNPEEYTSPVQRMCRPKDSADIIIITENSIYVVHGSMKKKTISPGSF